MTRRMIDVTHSNLPSALSAINTLKTGDVVAMYDTGSPDIVSTLADWKKVHAGLEAVLIDQGFTGSPNMAAIVRDCETGAWTIQKAVNRKGWTALRPTLYLGFPDTMQQAHDAGWRGDVWIAHSSKTAPTAPPSAPPGINVVAQQWKFAGPYDESVIFDPTWPLEATVRPDPTPTPAPVTLIGYVTYIQEGFKANFSDLVTVKVTSTDGGKTWNRAV